MFLTPAAAIVVTVAAVCFAAGWTAQGWRMQSSVEQLQAQHAEQAALQQSAMRAMESHFNEQMHTAMQEANAREHNLRAAAAAAGNSAARLRTQLQQLRHELASADAANPAATALKGAAAAADILAECAAEYQQLAAKADRHASDAVTCRAAWPGRNTTEND